MGRTLMCAAIGLALTASGAVVGQQPPPSNNHKVQYTQGKVVQVLAEVNTLIVRIGEGPKAMNMEYRVNNGTKFWGPDRQVITNGLRYAGFKEGNEVWIRPAPGQSQQLIGELKFFNPSAPAEPHK